MFTSNIAQLIDTKILLLLIKHTTLEWICWNPLGKGDPHLCEHQ
jgi:hypothetical protein